MKRISEKWLLNHFWQGCTHASELIQQSGRQGKYFHKIFFPGNYKSQPKGIWYSTSVRSLRSVIHLPPLDWLWYILQHFCSNVKFGQHFHGFCQANTFAGFNFRNFKKVWHYIVLKINFYYFSWYSVLSENSRNYYVYCISI